MFVATISGRLDDDAVSVNVTPNVETPQGSGNFENTAEVAPSCTTINGLAFPPVRLNSFANAFRNNTVTEICQEDLAPALTQIAERLVLELGSKCVCLLYTSDAADE